MTRTKKTFLSGNRPFMHLKIYRPLVDQYLDTTTDLPETYLYSISPTQNLHTQLVVETGFVNKLLKSLFARRLLTAKSDVVFSVTFAILQYNIDVQVARSKLESF